MIYKSELPTYWLDVVYYFGTNKGWFIKDFDGLALVLTDGEHLDKCIISERFANEKDAKYWIRHEADFFTHEEPPSEWKLDERTQKWWDVREPL